MINFSFDHFEETAIPLKWIRERLNLAKSRSKLVILDACHAGSAKDQSEFVIADTESMAKEMQSTQIATLASSKAEQKSWLWSDRKHSLFTYWLIEGLQGNADQNADQIIDLNELQNYIATNVAKVSSNTKGMMIQNPVLLNGDKIDKLFNLRLKARKINDALQHMAEQIDFAIQHSGAGLVMVPEFTSADESKISSDFGILARNLAKKMENQLKTLSEKKYFILDENETRQILTENNLKTIDLGTSKTKHLKIDNEQVKWIVLGKMTLLPGNKIFLETSLKNTQDRGLEYSASETVILSESDVAQLGVSFQLWHSASSGNRAKPQKRPNEYVVDPGAGLVSSDDVVQMQEVDAARENAKKLHPMEDESLPTSVSVHMQDEQGDYQPVTGKALNGNYYIPLKKGKKFAVYVSNKL